MNLGVIDIRLTYHTLSLRVMAEHQTHHHGADTNNVPALKFLFPNQYMEAEISVLHIKRFTNGIGMGVIKLEVTQGSSSINAR